MDKISYIKTEKIFKRLIIGIFAMVTLVELAMFVMLHTTNMIFQSLTEYIMLYLVRPILTNSLIIGIGFFGIRKAKNLQSKGLWNIVTLMCLCTSICAIHNVFIVTLLCFCLVISVSAAFQDRAMLRHTFISSIFIVLVIAIYNALRDSMQSQYEYYWHSIILIIFILIATYFVSTNIIELLDEKTNALEKAVESANEAQRQADAANRSKSVFLSNMSHEIRTPINAVLGMDEMILRESSESEIIGYANDIKSAGQALLSIINDILDFSKIESGRMELINAPYHPGKMIHDIEVMISAKAKEKGLVFAVDVATDIPCSILGDELRIRQVLINLLTNAVKYTDKGKVDLCVSGQKKSDDVYTLKFEVKDTGRGIKEEDLKKLFTPFTRIEEEKNRSIEGTGLGMSITMQLLNMMGSELKVNSTYGVGSTFTCEIEQQIVDKNPIGAYKEIAELQKNKGEGYSATFVAPDKRVLVVDDVLLNIKVIKGLLKKTQLQVDEALSGAEALKKLEDVKYDILLVDHMMPEMDGIELLDRIKASGGINTDTPAIALTANAIAGMKEFYLDNGFDGYLSKPVIPAELENTLREMM